MNWTCFPQISKDCQNEGAHFPKGGSDPKNVGFWDLCQTAIRGVVVSEKSVVVWSMNHSIKHFEFGQMDVLVMRCREAVHETKGMSRIINNWGKASLLSMFSRMLDQLCMHGQCLQLFCPCHACKKQLLLKNWEA